MSKTNDIKSVTAERVKEIRTLHNMTRADFGSRIGLSEDMINKIEQGRNNLTIDNAIIIANTFGVTLDYIYGNSENLNNEAAKIICELRKYFKIRLENVKNHKNEDKRLMFVTINENIYNLLLELDNVETLKNDSNYPFSDSVFDSMINDIMSRYNELLKSSDPNLNIKDFAVVEYEIKTEVANTANPPSSY